MRKRRDDDEFAIIKALYANENSSINRSRIHTSILTGDLYVREVLEGHELRCKRDFRMEKHIFRNLVECLREKCHLRDTDLSLPKNKLPYSYMLFLRMQAVVHFKGNFSIAVRP